MGSLRQRKPRGRALENGFGKQGSGEGESRGRKRWRIEDETSKKEEDYDDQDYWVDKSKGKKVVGDRRKISSEELAKVKSGEALGGCPENVGSSIPEGPGFEVGQSFPDETRNREEVTLKS